MRVPHGDIFIFLKNIQLRYEILIKALFMSLHENVWLTQVFLVTATTHKKQTSQMNKP